MCWNKPASLTTFIIGWSLSLLLILRNKPMDKIWGILFMFVTSMQLLEFLIWSDQKNGNCNDGKFKGKLNNVASQIASIQNLLQPVIGGVILLVFLPRDKFLFSPVVFALIILIYFITIVVWIFTNKLYKKTLCTIPCSKSGCQNHNLQWQWLKDDFSGKYIWYGYFISLLVLLIAQSKTKGGLYLSIFLILTCIISATVYPFKKAMGSWWCVMAVMGPMIKLLIPADNLLDNVF